MRLGGHGAVWSCEIFGNPPAKKPTRKINQWVEKARMGPFS